MSWRWVCVVIAPNGIPIPGTEAVSQHGAIAELLGAHASLWAYARSQGYRTSWVKEEKGNDLPPELQDFRAPGSGVIAGPITIGRGARWGAGHV